MKAYGQKYTMQIDAIRIPKKERGTCAYFCVESTIKHTVVLE